MPKKSLFHTKKCSMHPADIFLICFSEFNSPQRNFVDSSGEISSFSGFKDRYTRFPGRVYGRYRDVSLIKPMDVVILINFFFQPVFYYLINVPVHIYEAKYRDNRFVIDRFFELRI